KPEYGGSSPHPAPGSSMRQEPSTPAGSHHGTETTRRGPANGAPVTYDRPMPAEATGNLREAARHGTFQEVRYLVEKLGTQPAPISGSPIPPLPKLTSQPAFTGFPDVVASDTAAADGASDLHAAIRTSSRPLAADTGTDVPADVLRTSLPSAIEPSPRASGLNAFLEQALMLPMVSLVAREGFAQPLVAYPPVPLPPEEEERDIEWVSAIDEDGDGHPAGQDHEGEPEAGEEDDTDED